MIHFNDLYDTFYHKKPSPIGHEIYNFGRPFLIHHYWILNLSDPCTSVDNKRRRPIAFSLYSHALTQEPVPRGSWNLVDSSSVIIIILTVCLIYNSMKRRRFLKKYCIFTIWLVWPRPSTRTPVSGITKFAIFVDPSLVIITIHLVCLNNSLE